MAPRTRGMAAAEAAADSSQQAQQTSSQDAPLQQANQQTATPALTSEASEAPQTDSDKKHFPFLMLSGELRNRIYRMAIVSDTDINVTTQGYNRPALINVNRQIRSEALKIFYYESKFHAFMASFDPSLIRKWERHLRDMKVGSRKTDLTFRGNFTTTPSWKNLMTWARMKHKNAIRHNLRFPADLVKDGSKDMVRYTVGGMFATLKRLKGQPWKVVHEVLKEQRPTLVMLDKRWGDD